MNVNLSAREIGPRELPRASSVFEICTMAVLAVLMGAALFCIYTFV